jgi:hypothetical protein
MKYLKNYAICNRLIAINDVTLCTYEYMYIQKQNLQDKYWHILTYTLIYLLKGKRDIKYLAGVFCSVR